MLQSIRNRINADYLKIFVSELEVHFVLDSSISVLDLGGQDGVMSDLVLEKYPNSTVTLVDVQSNLDKNVKDERKQLVQGSIFDLDELIGKDTKYDLILFNWQLETVTADTFRATMQEQEHFMGMLRGHLAENGAISMLENFYPSRYFKRLGSFFSYLITRGFKTRRQQLSSDVQSEGKMCRHCLLAPSMLQLYVERNMMYIYSVVTLNYDKTHPLRKLFIRLKHPQTKNIWIHK